MNITANQSMQVLGLLCIVLLIWILLSAQRDKTSKIDLNYLLVDTSIGNVTLGKFGGLIMLFASTWIIIDITVTGHFDSTAYIGYMAAWGAVKIAGDITSKPPAPGATVTTERTVTVGASPPAPAAPDGNGKTLTPEITPSDVGGSVVIEPPTNTVTRKVKS